MSGFLIELAFAPGGDPGADHSDSVRPVRVDHNHQPKRFRHPDRDEPLFVGRVVFIWKGGRQRVIQDRTAFREMHPVFLNTPLSLVPVPCENHHQYTPAQLLHEACHCEFGKNRECF